MSKLSKVNITVASVLSFLGPIGLLYIGLNFTFWAFFYSAVFIYLYDFLLLYTLNQGIQLPLNVIYVSLLAWVFFGHQLAVLRNEIVEKYSSSEKKQKQFKSFGFGFIHNLNLFKLYLQFYTVGLGLYAAFGFFKSGDHEWAPVALAIIVVVIGLLQVLFVGLQKGLTKLFKYE
ncbi:hypothetical protein [Flammeovirga agarivorans]|uniref:Uncharacterized protein n=1 Tax=Flammeovirga agarivorans TaxID=2726742 RepID=A0A7X8XY28_9BACT|nr:hypothetical protein [Flammeovirga agarivorans]NLR93829.1 hypothetical protein [Flammeovirga agarivorans]